MISEIDTGLVPKLRFPNFNEQWQLQTLGQICKKKISYGIVQAGPHIEGGMPYIKSMDLNVPLSPSNLECTSQEIAQKYRRSEVKPNDIVFSLRGNIGVSQIVPNSIAVANLTQGTARISPTGNVAFFQQQLQTRRIKKLVAAVSKGSTFKEISLEELRKISIASTSDSEQQKIADFLTSVDSKIQQLQRKYTLMQQYKKGVMKQLFSQQVRFKDDDGKDYTDWVEKQLGDVLTIGSGRDYKHLNSGDIPVYGTGGHMLSVDEYLYDGESVCIGRKGTIDKPVFLNGKFWTVDTLFYTHNFRGVIPKFIFAIFQQINWKQYNEASGVPSLSKTTIEKIEVRLPCVNEQQRIANFLDEIDNRIQYLNLQIMHSKDFKRGLLQQMFI